MMKMIYLNEKGIRIMCEICDRYAEDRLNDAKEINSLNERVKLLELSVDVKAKTINRWTRVAERYEVEVRKLQEELHNWIKLEVN